MTNERGITSWQSLLLHPLNLVCLTLRKHGFASALIALFILNSYLGQHIFFLLQWNSSAYLLCHLTPVCWITTLWMKEQNILWWEVLMENKNLQLHIIIHVYVILYLIPFRHSPGKNCCFAHWCRTGPNLCCYCIHCNNAPTHKFTQLKCIIKHRVRSTLKPQRGFGKLRLVIKLPNNPSDCKSLFWFTVRETKGN